MFVFCRQARVLWGSEVCVRGCTRRDSFHRLSGESQSGDRKAQVHLDIQLKLGNQLPACLKVHSTRSKLTGNNWWPLSLKVRRQVREYFFNCISILWFQLVYSLNTGRDYGTILCWAENEMGVQSNPCVFHLIPAGKTIIELLIITSLTLL